MPDRLHYVARALDLLVEREDAAHDAYFSTAGHPSCERESRRLLVSLGEACGARAMAYRLARQLLVVRVDAPGAMALAASLAAQGVPLELGRRVLVEGARLRGARRV